MLTVFIFYNDYIILPYFNFVYTDHEKENNYDKIANDAKSKKQNKTM